MVVAVVVVREVLVLLDFFRLFDIVLVVAAADLALSEKLSRSFFLFCSLSCIKTARREI